MDREEVRKKAYDHAQMNKSKIFWIRFLITSIIYILVLLFFSFIGLLLIFLISIIDSFIGNGVSNSFSDYHANLNEMEYKLYKKTYNNALIGTRIGASILSIFILFIFLTLSGGIQLLLSFSLLE